MPLRDSEPQAWHTPHSVKDVAIMNDAHRQALCSGSILDSGVIWAATEGRVDKALLHAVGFAETFAPGFERSHACGFVDVAGIRWGWRFSYFEDKSLERPADAENEQVYRLLTIAAVGQREAV